MNPLLKDFRNQFLEKVLNLLWQQWSALGAAGSAEGDLSGLIDSEALLAASCVFGRYEPRLFDEMLDWLQLNGWVLNTQRLGTLVREQPWAGAAVLGAVADFLKSGKPALKWARLAKTLPRKEAAEPLFFLKDGRPLPVVGEPEARFANWGLQRGPLSLRGYSQPFAPLGPGNLVPQLRALLGISVRAEMVAYLLTHESGHAAEIARATCYHKQTVQQVLGEMNRSGIVEAREAGREKLYWIRAAEWRALLHRPEEPLEWRTWPPLWNALEQIWQRIEDPKTDGLDPLTLSSVLRELMVRVRPGIERAGLGKSLSDDRLYLAESYLPVFMADVDRVLDDVALKLPGGMR